MSQAGLLRLLIGLVQGVALYALFEAAQHKAWPSTDAPLFAALLTCALVAPLAAVTALSSVRPHLLVAWTLFIALIAAGTAWHSISRGLGPAETIVPMPEYWLALGSALFIAHSLFVAGSIDKRRIARYPTYFDVSWKFGVQAALAAAFAGAFWLLLWLGAELFRLIQIDALQRTIQKGWFWIPATTLALTCALHVTDARVGIVRGVRMLSCTLLSWLLPLMTLLAIAFIATLPFTGLEPLWNTRRAATILLVAAASLIVLMNTAYQDGMRTEEDGHEAREIPRPLRWAMLAASAAIIPLTLLAAYAISLRVRQYGWTPERIFATAAAAIAACYTIGYAIALLGLQSRFAVLERTNVATAFVVLAALAVLFTPIADPARLSVADQVARLKAGLTSPDTFDYSFLRFQSGRYGLDALRRLAAQEPGSTVAAKSAQFLQRKDRYPVERVTAVDVAKNVRVTFPQGASLPQAFVNTDWREQRADYAPACLVVRDLTCNGLMADIDGDGKQEILIVSAARVSVYSEQRRGWSYLGEISNGGCSDIGDALLAGKFEVAPSPFQDLTVQGLRLHLNLSTRCPGR